MMPAGYCTGISQPPKSTILAPSATWRLKNGVLSSALTGCFPSLAGFLVSLMSVPASCLCPLLQFAKALADHGDGDSRVGEARVRRRLVG